VFPSSSQDFPTASHALAKLELPYIHKLQKREGREGKGRGGPWGKGSTKVLLLGSAQCLGKICAGFQNCWSPFLAKANGRGRILRTSIFEGRSFVLFCSYEIHRTRMLQIVFFFGKLSMRRGGWGWFRGVWTCGAKVLEY